LTNNSNNNRGGDSSQREGGVLSRLRNTITGLEEQHGGTPPEIKRSSSEMLTPISHIPGSRSTFTPPFDVTTWLHPDSLAQYASVYIWLPTNANENTLSIKVIDEGTNLQVKIDVPPPFLDMEVMHKRWLKDATAQSEKYHPKYMAYKTLISEWKMENEDDQTSISIISLPFPCKSNIDISNLAWSSDETLVVNVDLSRSDEDLVEHKRMKPFDKD